MHDASRRVVVLTATIRVDERVPSVSVRSIDGRMRQYVSAIESWQKASRQANYRLIVSENSGMSEELRMSLGCSVEVVQSRIPSAAELHLGKGYCEALSLSQLLPSLGENSFIVKCSGRSSLANAARLLSRLDQGISVLVEPTLDLGWIDSRLFAGDKQFFVRLTERALAQIDEKRGVYLEHILAREVASGVLEGATTRILPLTPVFQGSSGTSGVGFNSLSRKFSELWERRTLTRTIRRPGST